MMRPTYAIILCMVLSMSLVSAAKPVDYSVQIASMDTRITTLEANEAQDDALFVALQTAFNTFVATTNSDLSNILARVIAIETSDQNQDDAIADIVARLDALEEENEAQAALITSLQSQLTAVQQCTENMCSGGGFPTCGNGIVEAGEFCDQGAQNGACPAFCGNNCQANSCGVGFPDGTACNDGNACTTNDTYQAGVCVGGSPVTCDDGNVCTVDTCSAFSGCTNTVDQSLCPQDADMDGSPDTEDCDPSNPAVHPGAAEICDSIDNDCDADIDEGDVCANQCTPTGPEVCNNVDDDCDGQVDESAIGAGQACGGDVGACQQGVTVCTNGALVCMGDIDPATESCNGVDDDCDGFVDEGFNVGATCGGGIGQCAATGVTVCTPDGSATTCQITQQQSPSAEICDGADNDCDGVVDEGNPGGGQSCSTGMAGACAAGTRVCANGGLVCMQTVGPTAEICNARDDDCDGVVDEGNPGGGQFCVTGKLGVCAEGSTVCAGGMLSCQQTRQQSFEVCDAEDNDCDGLVDENPSNLCGGTLVCFDGLCEDPFI
jgi:hypothetical protein